MGNFSVCGVGGDMELVDLQLCTDSENGKNERDDGYSNKCHPPDI